MRECLPKRDTRAFGIGTTSSESRAVDIRISSGAEPQYGVVKHGLQAGIRCFGCGCIDTAFVIFSGFNGRTAPLKRSLWFLKVPLAFKNGDSSR